MKIVGATDLGDLWALELACHTRVIRNLNLKSQLSMFYSFRDIRVHTYDFLKFVGVKVGVANFFRSIDRY